jgi:hypothetical protein
MFPFVVGSCPTYIPNGHLDMYCSRFSYSRHLGSTCTFTCDTGYHADYDGSLTCLFPLQWNPNVDELCVPNSKYTLEKDVHVCREQSP